MEDNFIVGLDIGTTKISCVIGEKTDEGVNIIGVGNAPSLGLKRGIIINIEKTVQAIKQAVKEAEKIAGFEVDAVYAGISGDHIHSITSKGVVAISNSAKEITNDDVERAIENAKAMALPASKRILHVIPQEFKVDNLGEIPDPVGMNGVRLEVNVYIITAALSAIENVAKSVERAGMELLDVVLEPLACSYSVLKEDERQLGVSLIDLGGGTSDIAMFWEDKIHYSRVVPIGGQHITNDIAFGLRTPVEKAEEIKIKHGSLLVHQIKPDETVDVPGVGGRHAKKVARSFLVDIMGPRAIEILQMVRKEMEKSDLMDLMKVGAVITGGTALIPGLPELAEEILDMPVKIAKPGGITGGLVESVNSPVYATAVGLIMYAIENDGEEMVRGTSMGSLSEKIKNWLKNIM